MNKLLRQMSLQISALVLVLCVICAYLWADGYDEFKNWPLLFSQASNLTSLVFTSGYPETGRQEIVLPIQEQGSYLVTLASANEPWSGKWLIWDFIALRNESENLWMVGDAETPPDYSELAFDEFCDPNKRQNCMTEFIVGNTHTHDFIKELNDGRFPKVTVKFDLTQAQVSSELRLTISTLYATHNGADSFAMNVSWKKSK